MVLVKEKVPLASKVLVAMRVHWLKGSVALVEAQDVIGPVRRAAGAAQGRVAAGERQQPDF